MFCGNGIGLAALVEHLEAGAAAGGPSGISPLRARYGAEGLRFVRE